MHQEVLMSCVALDSMYKMCEGPSNWSHVYQHQFNNLRRNFQL